MVQAKPRYISPSSAWRAALLEAYTQLRCRGRPNAFRILETLSVPRNPCEPCLRSKRPGPSLNSIPIPNDSAARRLLTKQLYWPPVADSPSTAGPPPITRQMHWNRLTNPVDSYQTQTAREVSCLRINTTATSFVAPDARSIITSTLPSTGYAAYSSNFKA